MKKSTGPILLIGEPSSCPDLEYATGFRAPGHLIFLRTAQRDHLIVPGFELARARRVCAEHRERVPGPKMEVVGPEEFNIRGKKQRRMSEWVLALLRAQGIRRVTVPSAFPYGIGERLVRAGIRLDVTREALFPARAVKTPAEQRKVREAQQAAVIAMRSAIQAIRASGVDSGGCLRLRGRRLTSEELHDLITRVLLDQKCLCRETIVAGGRQAADPHERGTGPLRAGEAIVIDIFPQHLEHGYCGDITRTVVKGQPPRVMQLVYNAVLKAQTAALAKVRAGVKAASVHRTVVEEFTRRGYRTGADQGVSFGFIHSTGHGVGLAVHEAPTISPGGEGKLRSGNIITVEPGLYYPDIGAVRIEDTVVVTPTGWRYLVPCEKVFVV